MPKDFLKSNYSLYCKLEKVLALQNKSGYFVYIHTYMHIYICASHLNTSGKTFFYAGALHKWAVPIMTHAHLSFKELIGKHYSGAFSRSCLSKLL